MFLHKKANIDTLEINVQQVMYYAVLCRLMLFLTQLHLYL